MNAPGWLIPHGMVRKRSSSLMQLVCDSRFVAQTRASGRPSGAQLRPFLSKLSSKLNELGGSSSQAMQQKLLSSAVQYNEAIAAANQKQADYLDVNMPSVFGSMQQLENTRLDTSKRALTAFLNIQLDTVAPLQVR